MGRSSLSSKTAPKPLVKANVVAQYLSCCEATILRMARTGRIPALKISNGCRAYWRFDLDEVRRLLKTQRASDGA